MRFSPTAWRVVIPFIGCVSAGSGSPPGHAYGIITGEGNTLLSLAQGARDSPAGELLDEHTLAWRVNLSVRGQFILRPGDRLRLDSPDWGKRSLWIVDGECQWEDCTVEGAVWVDVGNLARGFWKNVTIRAGEKNDYPLVYFRSPHLRWEGGLVDCFPAQGQPAGVALATREGYHPGAFTNTIRDVTFRCASTFLLDRFKQRDDVDLTFENCVIETSGDHHADLVSNVKVADGCSSVFTLKNCVRRHDGVDFPASCMISRGELQLSGSGCTVRFVEEGQVTEFRPPDLKRARMEPGNHLKICADTLAELGPRLDQLSAQEPLRGTLCYARARLEELQTMRRALETVGWYGQADVAWADGVFTEIRDTLDHAPLTLQTGSRLHPAPAPPDSPPPGQATIRDEGRGQLRVKTWASEWVYFRNPEGDRYATFLPESQVHGRPVFGGADPKFGGPSVRYMHPNASGKMLWEHPWQTTITKSSGGIVAFETELRTSPTLGTRATWIFFYDRPEVILGNCCSLQSPAPGQSYQSISARFQAYARPDLGTYNGLRLWNSDPQGVRMAYAPFHDHLDVYEPEYGFFFAESPAWYYTPVSRGLVLAQWNGYNDWTRNPPCGYIVRPEHFEAAWSGRTSSHYSHVVQVKQTSPPRGPEDLNHQVLWFEGAGFRYWDPIFNLEAAFAHPCQPLLDLTGPGRGELKLWEREGLARQTEIVVLPSTYSALDSELEWYCGDVCVTLLRNVGPHAEVKLGTLPVTAERRPGGFILRNDGGLWGDVWVRLPAEEARNVKLNGEPRDRLIRGAGEITFRCDLAPGRSLVEVDK